jgi:hypothetical protein
MDLSGGARYVPTCAMAAQPELDGTEGVGASAMGLWVSKVKGIGKLLSRSRRVADEDCTAQPATHRIIAPPLSGKNAETRRAFSSDFCRSDGFLQR